MEVKCKQDISKNQDTHTQIIETTPAHQLSNKTNHLELDT